MDQLVNVLITVEQQASSGTESLTYNISDVMANERCLGGLKLETNYKVCINATYRDLDDMQQDCNFTTTSSQLNPTNNGIQCSLPNTSTTTTTGTPQRSRMYTFSSLGTRPSHAEEEGGCLRVWFWLYNFSYLLTLHVTSLLPRLPHPPGFDDLLQCTKTPIEGVVHCITWLLMSGWQALPDEKNDLLFTC